MKAHQVTGAFLVLFSIGAVVRAQDLAPPGLVARFDVTQRLEYSDNPGLSENGESEAFGRTILGFSLTSETKVQRFLFNLGTDIEEGRDNQPTFDFRNKTATLGYNQVVQDANFGLGLRYRESDNDSRISDEEFDLDSDVIDQDRGTRKSYGANLDGAFGRTAPIGGNYQLSFSEIDYSGADDPDLTNRSNMDLSGQLIFRFDPRILGRLTAKYIDFDTGGSGVDRETTGLGAGVRLDVTPLVTADIGLSYDNIDRSGDETGTDDGVSATIDLFRTLSNGRLGLSFSSDVSSNDDGRRTFVSVVRDMDLSRISSLFLSLGATSSDQAGTDPLMELRYSREQRSSRFNVSLSQSVTTDNENQERINSALRVSYDHLINSQSSFGVDVGLFDRNELGQNPDDGQRLDVGLTYRHELTRDWGLVSGYTYRRSTSDSRSDRSSNTIFVGLQRSFSWNP